MRNYLFFLLIICSCNDDLKQETVNDNFTKVEKRYKEWKKPEKPIEVKLEKDYIKNLILNDELLKKDLESLGIDLDIAFPNELAVRVPQYYCLGFRFDCAFVLDLGDVDDDGDIDNLDVDAIRFITLGSWDIPTAIANGFPTIADAGLFSCAAICGTADVPCENINSIDLLATSYWNMGLVECY